MTTDSGIALWYQHPARICSTGMSDGALAGLPTHSRPFWLCIARPLRAIHSQNDGVSGRAAAGRHTANGSAASRGGSHAGRWFPGPDCQLSRRPTVDLLCGCFAIRRDQILLPIAASQRRIAAYDAGFFR